MKVGSSNTPNIASLQGPVQLTNAADLIMDQPVEEVTSTSGLPCSIIVMRHGRRWDSRDPAWASRASHPWDTPLSSDANVEINAAATLLQAKGKASVDVVYCSPFLRCIQTAELLLGRLGLSVPVYIHRGMSEVHAPNLIHKCSKPSTLQKLRKWAWNAGYKQLSRSARLRFAHGKAVVLESQWPAPIERDHAAGVRFLTTIQECASRHPGQRVLFVSHGKSVQMALEAFATVGTRVEQVHFCGFTVGQPKAAALAAPAPTPEEPSAGTQAFFSCFEPDADLPMWGVDCRAYTASPGDAGL